MKLSYWLLASAMALACCVAASAAPVPKDREKEHEGKEIDTGSFGVYQNGHRVGTETFSIYQTGNGSIINSEFKTVHAPPDEQSSEMRLTANGDIKRYEWKETSPDVAESLVVPNDDFLTQKFSSGPQDKEHEQPYLLSPSTSILDDYSFIQREVLAWKFIAETCSKQKSGLVQCPLRQRTRFATMNPHERTSASLSVESLGRETVNLRSGSQDLNKLELKNDAGTWQLWLDDQWKVMRMVIVGENTEVERD
ncbi:MAG: hypothetical protein WBW53_04180 [Terriglobales bacterium]